MTDKDTFQLLQAAISQKESDQIAISEANFWIAELDRLELQLKALENSDEKFSPDFNDKVAVIIKNLEAVAGNMDLELQYFKNANIVWDNIERQLKK